VADARSDGYRELGSAHVIAGRAFTAPVFANEKVFVRNIKGDVVCLDFPAQNELFRRNRLRLNASTSDEAVDEIDNFFSESDAGLNVDIILAKSEAAA